MARIGKNIKLIATFLILGCLFTGTIFAQTNARFYSIVQQTCSNYKIKVSKDQIKIEDLESGNGTFRLILHSMPRNNHEQVMVIGYIAAGQAISHTGLAIKTIRVTVVIPAKKEQRLTSEADVALVDQMRNGRIKPSDFLRQLDWY